jgi:gliding motility-associated-like protein
MEKRLLGLLITFFSVTSYGQLTSTHTPGQAYSNAAPRNLTPNGSGSLGQSYVMQNVCGLNYVTTSILTETRSISAGFNTTGTGFPCTLLVAGLPCGATILKAYAYWSAEYTEAAAPTTSIALTNPAATTSTTAATTIGTGAFTYWGNNGTSCYRADITADIAGNGNYKVNLTGFANAAWEADGVAIIIVYTNPAATYSGSISLWDGCIVNSATNANIGPETLTGFTACAASTTNSAFVLLGDCQTGIAGNGNVVTNDVNGTTASFPPAFWQLNISNNTTITNGQTSISDNTYTNNTGEDAFVWELAGLYWENTSCVTCTPTTFTASIADVAPSCGSNNGTATVTTTGGSAPYTYAWSTGGTTDEITGLGAGTYTVKVSDACASATATVTLPASSFGVTANTTANETCNGTCVGSASSTATGGTPPYTYAWTPTGGTSPTASNLCAGTYTITVQDASGGCSATATATITQPTLLGVTAVPDNILCFGGVGSATSTATGGTPPYTYGWNTIPPQLSNTATGLSAGTYSLGVEDNNGCTATNTVVITQPAAPIAATATMTPALCENLNGIATVSASGGTAPYTYLWAPSGGNAATANGLSAGSYTATVSDNNGCATTTVIVVNSIGGPDITLTSQTNDLCNGGNTGTAITNTTGGTVPYTYTWTGGQATANANGLTAGNYTVTVKDNNGCSSSVEVTITQPTALGTTTSFTHASCNLSNGSASVTVTGGTAPYTYLWEPSAQITPTAAGISAGSYTVGIEDNNGCPIAAVVDVTQPSAPVVSIGAITNVSCFGEDNGSIETNVVGGTAPYGYAWAPSGGNGATGTGFAVGCYTVTAHDANGCTTTAGACITQPALLTSSINGPSIICAGTTGTLTANVNGGTQPYNYTWSGVGIASATSTASVTPTSTQTYTVSVVDANGCTTSAQFTINFGPPMTISIVGPTSICPGQDANLCSVITGGTGGNSYTWTSSTGGTYSTPCISLTPAETTSYTLSVVDNCGSFQLATTTIQINPYPVVNFAADLYQGCTPLCVQFYNNTTIAGGSAESYSWLFGNGDSSHLKEPVYCYPGSGDYDVTLTVVSDSGCSATLKKTRMINVFTPPVAAFALSPQPATILNPTIQFADHSTDAYNISYWSWNFGDGVDSTSTIENPAHTYQDTGSYCARLIVIDQHGCMDTVTNCLVIDPVFNIYIPSAFSPNGNGLNETFTAKGEYIKTFEMYIFDRWGEQLYHTTNINQGWDGTVKGGSAVSQEDIYVYKILATDAQNDLHSYIGSVTLIK